MSSAPDSCRSSPTPTGPLCLQLQQPRNSKKRPRRQSRRQRQRQPGPSPVPTPPSADDEYDSDISSDSDAETAAAERATKCQLHALLRCYSAYYSARQWRAWSELFTEDALLNFQYCGQIHGRNEIYYAVLGMDQFSYNSSFCSNIHLELDSRRPDERATGTANIWYNVQAGSSRAQETSSKGVPPDPSVRDDQEGEPSTADCEYCGPYEFEFVRNGGGWKIKTMSLKVLDEHREERDRSFTKCDYIPPSTCGTPCR